MSAAEPQLTPAQARMRRLRLAVQSVKHPYGVMADGEGTRILSMEDGALAAIIPKTCPVDDAEYILQAVDAMPWVLENYDKLYRKNRALLEEIERLSPPPPKPKDYARECAMKCAERPFLRFLEARHDLPPRADKQAVETRIRSILAIPSRADLNTNPDAAARWRSMVAEFDNWRHGR